MISFIFKIFSKIYLKTMKPLFFQIEAERAHHAIIATGKLLQFCIIFKTKLLSQKKTTGSTSKHFKLGKLTIKNPIGIAAGFDKNAEIPLILEKTGFGFIEIGTVTPKPQAGNVKPRLERFPEKEAILNRMGFNNDGAVKVKQRVHYYKSFLSTPIGVNIGKNKVTPQSAALHDYAYLLQEFKDVADYFVVNLSSPNTPGLRDLQNEKFLLEMESTIRDKKIEQDVFLKVGPDLELEKIKSICKFCGPDKPFAGLVLTNTIPTDLGGISGKPLANASLRVLKEVRSILDLNIPVISVGGIFSGEDAQIRMKEGASAIQVYTGLVYKGPQLISDIARALN